MELHYQENLGLSMNFGTLIKDGSSNTNIFICLGEYVFKSAEIIPDLA